MLEFPAPIQSSRSKSTSFAAADSGSKESSTSIQAQTFPDSVRDERKASPAVVRPEQDEPTSSVIAAEGKPPPKTWSSAAMPVGVAESNDALRRGQRRRNLVLEGGLDFGSESVD